MPDTVDVYFSFRSPYSYLATPGMLDVARRYDVQVALRPVLPLALRDPGFFNPDNQKRALYIRIDWVRRAEFLGMPGRWPKPDPIVQDMETFAISPEQPYIHRLSRLGVQAQREGKGPEFAKEVSHLLFGGTRDWHQGGHLADAVQRAGLDLAQMEAAVAGGDHDDELARNQQSLATSGHWGVPTLVFRNEPFFGQDRIETLCWRLDKLGLRLSGTSK